MTVPIFRLALSCGATGLVRWGQTLAAVGLALLANSCVHAKDLAQPPDTLLAGRQEAGRSPGTGSRFCAQGIPGRMPVSLLDAVGRALCSDPRTRQAWAYIQTQQAQLNVDRAAYWPTLSANASVDRVDQRVTYTNLPGLESSLRTRSTDVGLTLSWVLYDFGLRAANLEHSRQLLNAAIASRNETLQTVFLDTVRVYYDAQTRLTLLRADRETERIAHESFVIAQAKFKAGAATLADKLQAKTAYSQAVLERMQAQSDLDKAMGALAVEMGLAPGVSLHLPSVDDDGVHQDDYRKTVDTLVGEAMHTNPSVLAARAKLEAARAEARSARSQSLPRLSLMASMDRSDTPITQVTSRQVINNRSIGLQLTIPIVDVGSHYQISKADAEVDARKADLAQARRTVSLDVWKSYEEFTSGLATLETANDLLHSARQSVKVAFGRYKAGVGSLLELLRAQSDLTNAERQRVLALTQWKTGQFKLAASLGQLERGGLPRAR
ncbi:MAG TPA: TolC family protein [Burkholderiaceae bacterium]|nr:TolC family protein [Burkholderiaceae bacterium]